MMHAVRSAVGMMSSDWLYVCLSVCICDAVHCGLMNRWTRLMVFQPPTPTLSLSSKFSPPNFQISFLKMAKSMSDAQAVAHDSIKGQGQGHETLKVRNSSISRSKVWGVNRPSCIGLICFVLNVVMTKFMCLYILFLLSILAFASLF